MRRQLLLLALLSLLATALCSTGWSDGCLLKASSPGAYAVRFWPDRIVLTYSTEAAVTVSVQLPAAAKWAVLDEAPLALGKAKWDQASSSATADLPAGDHTLLLGWAGSYAKPAANQKLPVLLDGKPVGSLNCHFDLEKMTAEGTALCPVGTVRVRLAGLKAGLQPVLTLGANAVNEWVAGSGGVEAAKPVAVQDATPLSLVIRSYNLLKSPVSAVELQTVQAALEPRRLEKMPEQGLVIEAESSVNEGLGKVEVSTKHFDLHGGKGIMGNSGEGHFLEYKFTLDKPGTYDLYMRAATQEPFDLRSLQIDGKTPAGLGLVKFPGTGGWGYSAAEWAALQLTGSEKAPSLKLEAGEHTLRITGEGSTHLNLDYFALLGR